jgi:hypothetical protein
MKKTWLLLTLMSILFLGCTKTQNTLLPNNVKRIDWIPEVVLTLTDAERILGEAGHLDEAVSYLDESAKVFISKYSSDKQDEKSGLV